MAAESQVPLIAVPAFKGMDLTSRAFSVKEGFAAYAQGANPSLVQDALTQELGRILFKDLSAYLQSISAIVSVQQSFLGGSGSNGTSCAAYLVAGLNLSGQVAFYMVYGPCTAYVSGAIVACTWAGSVPATLQPFDQAVQFGGVVYMNNGFRLFLNQLVAPGSYNLNLYYWQYPPPPNNSIAPGGGVTYGTGLVSAISQSTVYSTGSPVTVSVNNTTNFANGLNIVIDSGSQQETVPITSFVAGTSVTFTPTKTHNVGFSIFGGITTGTTVYYLITTQTTMPDGSISESSVNLAQYANPPRNANGGGVAYFQVFLTGGYTWSGTHTDAATYTTNLYRMSSTQPTWFLVASGLTGSGTYSDYASDAALTGNVQLEPQRDAPPCVPGSYGVAGNSFNFGSLCVHKNRVWLYVISQTTSTNNVPEVQLWYSNLGRGWEFDQLTQVLNMQAGIVNQYANPANNYSTTYDLPYGDDPIALGEVGSLLAALAKQEFWGVYGDDSTSFVQRDLFNVGCQSRHSVTPAVGGIFWVSENGPYFFNGAAPEFIGEGIRGFLQPNANTPAVTVQQLQATTGSFSNLIWYLSFVTLQTTLAYDVEEKVWLSEHPYAPQAVGAISSVPAYPNQYTSTGAIGGVNQVIAARYYNGVSGPKAALDFWFADPNNDLGSPGYVKWNTPRTHSQKPQYEKTYEYIVVYVPPGTQGSMTFLLVVDGNVNACLETNPIATGNTWTIADLSTNTRFIKTLGNKGAMVRGYTAQLLVTLTGKAGYSAPIVEEISVWGNMPEDRKLVVRA